MRIDLHSHSAASDGSEPPAAVVARARAAGVDVLALTDHDTLAGQAEAAAQQPAGLTLVSGAEVSCRLGRRSVHLLAYLFDPGEPALAAELARVREAREQRMRAMVEKLQALGVPISWEHVTRVAGAAPPGRPHLARALADIGAVEHPAQAFTAEWIAPGGRAYADRYAPDPADAIGLVRAAGGVAVLAHPGSDGRGVALPEEAIASAAAAGLAGIEVDHPEHDAATRARLRGLAADLGLLVTGGSDDHGTLTGHRLGAETTSPEVYDALTGQATGAEPLPAPGVRRP